MDGLRLEGAELDGHNSERGQHTATAMARRKWRGGWGRLAGLSAKTVDHIVSSICQCSIWWFAESSGMNALRCP